MHKLVSSTSGRVVLALLAVALLRTGGRTQSVREPDGIAPFAIQQADPLPAEDAPRQIDPIVLSSLLRRQTPQAVPPVQYKTSGKEFYVVFLSSVSSDPSGNVLRRVFVSSRAHVRVKISHVGGSWSQTAEVLPRSLTPLTLPTWASLDRFEMEAAFKRVFKIEAEDDVAVYALSPNYLSSDGFLVLPKESLGREYVVASVRNALWYGQGRFPLIGADPYPRSEFGVAAIEDGTEVTVKLTANSFTRRYLKDTNYKFTLRKGEVIQFMARDTGRKDWVNYWDNINQVLVPRMSWVGKELDGTDCDLTGSQVLSNKPVAVFSGHERASIPDQYEFSWEDHPDVSRDHIIEQMPPVEVWGKRFIVISTMQDWKQTRPGGGDVVRVMAHTDGTVVYSNGKYIDTLNAGEFTQFMSGEFAYVETTQPSLVVKYLSTADPKYTPGMGDPDMTVVPPVENMSTFYALPTIHLSNYFTEHFITLIIDSAALNSTMLNGVPVDNTLFKALPDLPYMFAKLRTDFQGEQRVESSLPCYAETYGYGDVDSYSFSGGGDFHYIRGLSANDLNFGFVKLGDSRDSVTTVLSTIPPSPLADTVTIFRYTWESGDTTVFGMLDTITTPLKIAPGETWPVSFSFKPKVEGAFSARVRVWSNNFTPVYIRVSGLSGEPCLQVDNNRIDFGRVRVGQLRQDKFDYYRTDINAALVKFDDDNFHAQLTQPVFSVNPVKGGENQLVPSGRIFTNGVSFTPRARGYYVDSINVSYNGSQFCDSAYVYISGRGILPEAYAEDVQFPDTRFTTSAAPQQIFVRNDGDDFTRVLSMTIDSGDIQEFTLTIPSQEFPKLLDTADINATTDELRYEVTFTPLPRTTTTPDLDGQRKVRVEIVTEDTTLYRYIRGRGVEPWFSATPDTIDFGIIRNPLISDPDRVTLTARLRNIGSMTGLLNAASIPPHAPDDSVYFTIEKLPAASSFAVDQEDGIDVSFHVKEVGAFFDSLVIDNDSRARPVVYLKGAVDVDFSLNDTIGLDTVKNCTPIDTMIRIFNPYRVSIKLLDTAFVGNPDGFSFFPGVQVQNITIPPGQEFNFTLRYEFPVDSVNGDQKLLLLFSKETLENGVLSEDVDTVEVNLSRQMQLLDLVAGKLPYNPNAKDAPFRLPIHIKGNRFGKSELDNMTVRLNFSNLLVAPVGIDRTGSLTESTATNGVPPQPNWTWDEATRTMFIPIKDAVISKDPTKNTLLFTLLGTTYLTIDTSVEITPEIAYDNKPCAYRISRDSTTVIYANECGDRTIRDLLLHKNGFSIGHPFPDPASSSDGSSVRIPYMSVHDVALEWKIYNELGDVCFTSPEQPVTKGIGAITIGKEVLRSSGLYLLEISVRSSDAIVDKLMTKFVVTE